MSRTSAIRDAWRPQTKLDNEAVLLELEQVLTSPHFCNSKRYPALLRYVVEATLDGRSDLLKERTIGVEVFDRPPSYDTNADTVVRYTAGEVRKRLSLYYHQLDRKTVIQISLPPGSYIPEFLHAHDDGTVLDENAVPVAWIHGRDPSSKNPASAPWPSAGATQSAIGIIGPQSEASVRAQIPIRRRRLIGIVAMLSIVLLAAAAWRYRAGLGHSPLDNFWSPVLRNQQAVLICTGGVVFNQGTFSGVVTAGKDVEYPFVSFQIASAIARVSGLVERSGSTTLLASSASTPLTELRDQPVILLGGYNNPWTMRLLDPLPFHFAPEPAAAIVDGQHPGVSWERDHALPYSAADDYGVIARFRDPKTDNWVVVAAGLGRNGTEAAAQFITSPHYMQQLRDRLGSNISSQNVEAVFKINVIDGKTGAPTILAVQIW